MAAGMRSAAMLATGVLRAVVVAMYVGVKVQRALEEGLHRLVGPAGYAAIQPNARRR